LPGLWLLKTKGFKVMADIHDVYNFLDYIMDTQPGISEREYLWQVQHDGLFHDEYFEEFSDDEKEEILMLATRYAEEYAKKRFWHESVLREMGYNPEGCRWILESCGRIVDVAEVVKSDEGWKISFCGVKNG